MFRGRKNKFYDIPFGYDDQLTTSIRRYIIECSDGSYGQDCSGSCGSCAGGNAACNHVDGTCAGGCGPGWTTGLCDQGMVLRYSLLAVSVEH